MSSDSSVVPDREAIPFPPVLVHSNPDLVVPETSMTEESTSRETAKMAVPFGLNGSPQVEWDSNYDD